MVAVNIMAVFPLLLSLHPCSVGSSSPLGRKTGHGVDSTPNLFSNPSHQFNGHHNGPPPWQAM